MPAAVQHFLGSPAASPAGRQLLLELRNDVKVSGKLAVVDEYMNMFVDNAVWQPVQGPSQLYPFLFLKGRNLRMVHLPDNMDAAATLDSYIATAKKQSVAAALQLINKPQQRLTKGAGSLADVEGAAEAAGAAAVVAEAPDDPK